MVFPSARSSFLCVPAVVVIAWILLMSGAHLRAAHQTLTPGQTSLPPQGQNSPGRPAQSQPDAAKGTGNSVPASVPNANNSQPSAEQVPLNFESHGLEYEALTKNGVTVMFAQLPSRLKDFNISQVTVTNGSLLSWTVKPTDFTFARQDGTVLSSVSTDYVVAELLQRADRDDVIKLQLLYENSIYGLSNFRSTNGYEKRREAAMAQFVNRGVKAAVEASAIAFVTTKLKPGDSTDGAIFFENHTKERGLGPGRVVAHSCGETFMFETYAELKKR